MVEGTLHHQPKMPRLAVAASLTWASRAWCAASVSNRSSYTNVNSCSHVRDEATFGRGHYHWRHETCWYAVKKGAQAHWAGDRKASTLWEIDNPGKSETGHSAQKPVECMQRAIHNHKGDVYDPFVGSGTTVIAGEQEGRVVNAIEIDSAYVDVTVKRWEAFTGRTATR